MRQTSPKTKHHIMASAPEAYLGEHTQRPNRQQRKLPHVVSTYSQRAKQN